MGEANELSDHNIIDTFCDFFQQHRRFPGSQDLIVVPKPETPYIIKTNKVISTNQLYQKLSSADARGLVSIQALAGLNMYNGGNTEISRQALSEFLHMSHQTLNKDNYNAFMQFDKTTELINELIFMLVDRRSQNIANAINNNIDNEINDYQFTFDAPAETKIQKNIENILKNKKNPPMLPPTSVPPSLLTKKEIDIERNKASEEFIKTSLLMSKDDLT